MNAVSIGRRRWAISEGYIPQDSGNKSPELTSHEAICILNTGDNDANIVLHAYFKDRDPAGPYHFTVSRRRVLHIRVNELHDPEPIPLETEYASLIESDVPIVVQHTRLDSRDAALALLSTIAYSE